MNYESKLLRLHGEVIIVTSSELTRKGEPKSNGEPSKIDYARIRFEWNGGSYRDMVSFENATCVHNIVAIAGSTEFVVDVDNGRRGPIAVLKPVEPRT